MYRDEKMTSGEVLTLFAAFILLFILFLYISRNLIGVVLLSIVKIDCLLTKCPLMSILQDSRVVTFDFSHFDWILQNSRGDRFFVLKKLSEHFKWLHMIYYAVLSAVSISILYISKKFFFDPLINPSVAGSKEKEKKVDLYPGVKLGKTNRKSLKGKIVDYSYFPIEFTDEQMDRFIENSIYYSLHHINFEKDRFLMLEEIWKEIVEKRDDIYWKYAVTRFEYMDRRKLFRSDSEDLFRTETAIFKENLDDQEAFYIKNCSDKILEYMRRYQSMTSLADPEKSIARELLSDIDVYLTYKHFRDGRMSRTIFKENIDENAVLSFINPNIDIEELKKAGMTEEKVKYMYDRLDILLYIRDLDDLEKLESYRFKQPILPRCYILKPSLEIKPIGSELKKERLIKTVYRKKLSEYSLNVAETLVEILNKFIIKDYIENINQQIKNVEEEIESLKKKGGSSVEQTISSLKAIIKELEQSRDLELNRESSRLSKINTILHQHNFEETSLISLWEYGMTLQNLPTGRLSFLKEINIIFWYAFTSLGRPFIFKPGLFIEIIREFEKRENSQAVSEITKIENADSPEEIIGEEGVKEIEENRI